MNETADTQQEILRRMTDSQDIKLLPRLQPWIRNLDDFKALQHPLVYAVPYHSVGFLNDNHNKRYAYLRAELGILKHRGEWETFVFMHERPWRLTALRTAVRHLGADHSRYWKLVSAVYTDTENLWQHQDDWRRLLTSRRPQRDAMMDDAERAFFATLPPVLTVYRGVARLDRVQSFSWTINREIGKWFAHRLTLTNAERFLATARLDRGNVIAYLSGRHESEIVLDPQHLRDIRVRKLTPSRMRRPST